MPNDITVTKNTTSGSERWDIAYTVDQSGTIGKTLLTAGKLMDRNEKISITTPAMTLPTAVSYSSSGTAKLTVNRNTATQYINIPTGYNDTASYYTISATPNMTLPTATSSTSSGTSKLSVTPGTDNKYINIPTGYNGTASYYTIKGDADLVASNIKKDVTIFGVTGTYEGGGMTIVTTQDSHGGDILTITGEPSSSYSLITSQEYTIPNFTTTSATSHATINLGSSYYTSNKIIYVKVRDKAGPRNGYFVGCDAYFFNYYAANNATTTLALRPIIVHRCSSAGAFTSYATGSTTGYGVYPYSITSAGALGIYKRYNSTYSLTINGTYVVEVYALDFAPTAGNPFSYSYPTS